MRAIRQRRAPASFDYSMVERCRQKVLDAGEGAAAVRQPESDSAGDAIYRSGTGDTKPGGLRAIIAQFS